MVNKQRSGNKPVWFSPHNSALRRANCLHHVLPTIPCTLLEQPPVPLPYVTLTPQMTPGALAGAGTYSSRQGTGSSSSSPFFSNFISFSSGLESGFSYITASYSALICSEAFPVFCNTQILVGSPLNSSIWKDPKLFMNNDSWVPQVWNTSSVSRVNSIQQFQVNTMLWVILGWIVLHFPQWSRCM